ncbi:MAG: chemotaxis response regulator protein-glutamate methylesterase [Calditrichaeota bacterium]|nr:MAG: chemotaxis response regulator protein-glutamate methylesterase [Calditrichota bacterium]
MIKVVVVDDSAFMRKALSMMLEADPNIKVIGTARDGKEGFDKVMKLKPDLVTMDIEMPRMDGLTALKQIMDTCPVPVMMVSSLTTDGASATLDALELGAVDFIPKQLSYVSLDIVKIKDELLLKIKDIVRRKHILMARYKQQAAFKKAKGTQSNLRTSIKPHIETAETTPSKFIRKRNHPVNIISIGSSTGGPPALQSVITKLPRNLPVGIVIAQHMPAMFTKSLADRLDKLSMVSVKEGEDGEYVQPGIVYIAPGGRQMITKKLGTKTRITITDQPQDSIYKPSVNVLVNSVVAIYGKSMLAVMLTGMGSDGLNAFKTVNEKGGKIIAQNEETCVVYGMPRAVVEASIADHISPINDIYAEIAAYF